MEIKQCKEFFYRVSNNNEEVFNNFNTSKENILRNNETLPIYYGEWLKIKENDYIVHCVKPVETLEVIAKKYEVSCANIVEYNQLKTNKLYIGQILKIYK